MMNAEKLARISALSQKSRIRPLSPEEAAEHAALRLEYRQSVVGNLKAQLSQITVVESEKSS